MSTTGMTWHHSPEKKAEFNRRRKKTTMERYGVENAAQSPEVQAKFQATVAKRRESGFVHKTWHYSPEQKERIAAKRKYTMLERYGVEYSMQSPELLNKSRETSLRKYGSKSFTQTQVYVDKSKSTNVQKYGTDWANQSPRVKEKITSSLKAKYGVANHGELKSIEWKRSHGKAILELSETGMTDSAIADQLNLNLPTVSKFLRSNGIRPGNITVPEMQIVDLLETKFPDAEFTIHDHTTLIRERGRPLEIDILIPEARLGIEVNGEYWHANDHPGYMHEKYKLAKKAGIDLLCVSVGQRFSDGTMDIIDSLIRGNTNA